MKKLLILLTILCSTSYAQEGRYSLRVHLGYGITNVLFPTVGEPKPAYNAGIEIRRQTKNPNFYLQTGIRWNEYGYKYDTQLAIWNGEYHELIDATFKSTHFYVSIPLIATYKSEKIIPGLTVSFGPQLSVYTFSKWGYNNDFSFSSGQESILNLGVHSAVGYERNLSEKWLLGGEIYSNINLPINQYFFDFQGNQNFGIGISGRYVL